MTVQTTNTSAVPALPLPGSALALPEVTGGHAGGLAVLADWLTAADAAQKLARQLVSSYFVPQAFKANPPPRADENEVRTAVETAVANATGAILLGQSLGLDPLTSLQQIYVVHGRPGMYTKIKVALAQARGHRVWDEEYTPTAVTVCGQRRGTDDVVRIRITIEDAKQAKWTDNAQYTKTPADMLWARAASRVVDRIAADVLFGIASIEDIDPVDEPAPAATRVTIDDVRGPAPAADPVREALEHVDAARDAVAKARAELHAPAAAVPSPATIDESTWRRVNESFVALGVTGPGQQTRRLLVLADIIGRPIAKGRDLTQAEGDQVLTALAGTSKDWLADRIRFLEDGAAAPAVAPSADVVDMGDADPDGDQDGADLEPTADELAAHTEQGGPEPAGWEQ